MTGPLAATYQETLAAQSALIALWSRVKAGTAAPADWNEAEESLEAAVERFSVARLEYRSRSTSKQPSPGFAGVPSAPIPTPAATESPPRISTPLQAVY